MARCRRADQHAPQMAKVISWVLLPLREEVSAGRLTEVGSHYAVRANSLSGGAEGSEKPHIRPASQATFSRKGEKERSLPCRHPPLPIVFKDVSLRASGDARHD